MVATLIRVTKDFDLAEEAVQEAFAAALERWPTSGVPPNPGAWITATARIARSIAFAASTRWPTRRRRSAGSQSWKRSEETRTI